VKLLFEHNLSPHLVKCLADLYPDSIHLHLLGLDRADDEVVWELARREGFLIVTKDADFSDLCLMRGFPPKVIWIRLGNCTTQAVEALLRRHREQIEALESDEIIGVLTLF
jgi:predicted nuclease of predicted toxin-antitoxin system